MALGRFSRDDGRRSIAHIHFNTGNYLLVLFLAISVGLGACSIHRGIKPIEPEVGHYSPVVVDSLSPSFRWKPLPQPETQYDLGIFAAVAPGQPMKTLYYREGLTVPEHKIEATLSPNTLYFWSVRFRRGTTIGPWANYNHTVVVPSPFVIFWHHSGNNLFPFKTPDVGMTASDKSTPASKSSEEKENPPNREGLSE